MSFISLTFIVFLLVIGIVYFLTPGKRQWIVLLIGSYVFYLFSGLKIVVFLLSTTTSIFVLGLLIGGHNKKYHEELKERSYSSAEKKQLHRVYNKKKKKYLLIALLSNFGILFILKYLPVFAIPIRDWIVSVRPGLEMPEFHFLLPLGISFYTFQAIGYIIDLYRDKYEPERNLFRFALFLSFFPQIVQGPISRFDELADQLYQPHPFSFRRLKFGLELMLWGFFKKMVIADHLAIICDTVFESPERYQGLYIVFAALLSWVQLYTDFSGGIDVARGVAQIFGITLPENFRRPFFADSLAEFWRRWHITLNNWWRDYIFYPLTLSKAFVSLGKKCKRIFGNDVGKKIPVMISLLIVRIVNSVWHGAYLIYFVGGLYHGIMIAMAFLLEAQFSRLVKMSKVNTKTESWHVFQVMRTFVLICIPRLIYKAASWADIGRYLKYTFSTFNPWIFFDESLYTLGLERKVFQMVEVSLGILFVVSFLQEKGYNIREKIEEQNLACRWLIYLIGILSVLLFGAYGIGFDASSFQYMQF